MTAPGEARSEVRRPAAHPDGDLACDFEIAVALREEGIRDRLARSLVGSPRTLEDGMELRLRTDAWDAVVRYIDVESQCCPFLDLAAARDDEGAVLLTIRGRPDAQPVIAEIFSTTTTPRR